MLLLLLLTVDSSVRACLTFCLHHGDDIVYGRNFDWQVDTGALFVNLRNVAKTAFVLPPDVPVSWVSKYGSVTFNQFSKEIPVGGMNERGLVVECLVAPAQYPARDRRKAITELQWIQYQLDTCQNVPEVVRDTGRFRITRYALDLHYFVSDRTGNSAVIEFNNGKMVCRTGRDLPVKVLANRAYSQDLLRVLRARNQANKAGKTTASAKGSRFTRTAQMLADRSSEKASVPYAFEVLDAAAQGDFTKWRVVYDVANAEVHFRTLRNRAIRIVALSELDFGADGRTLMLNLNTGKAGAVNERFVPCTEKRNDALIQLALGEFRKARILQNKRPEHVQVIRTVVRKCRRVPAADDDR